MTDNPTTAAPGSTGYGQQDPLTSNSEYSVMTFVIRQMMAKLDTMKPVKVIKVTGGGGAIAAAGTVDVQPLVSQIDGGGNATQHGVVYGIPWFRLQGGKSAVIVDPEVGDIGFVICADRDISGVKGAIAAGKEPMTTPGSRRKYNIADGIYVGGALAKDAPERYFAFTSDGIKVRDKNGNELVLNADGIKASDAFGNVIETRSTGIRMTPAEGMFTEVAGRLLVTEDLLLGGSIVDTAGGVYAGNIITSGAVQAGGIDLAAHHHTQANDGHGDVEQPTSSAVP